MQLSSPTLSRRIQLGSAKTGTWVEPVTYPTDNSPAFCTATHHHDAPSTCLRRSVPCDSHLNLMSQSEAGLAETGPPPLLVQGPFSTPLTSLHLLPLVFLPLHLSLLLPTRLPPPMYRRSCVSSSLPSSLQSLPSSPSLPSLLPYLSFISAIY